MHSVSSNAYVFLRAKTSNPLWVRLLRAIREWNRRAQSRRELARLSYLDIKDIGFPADVAAEKNKPFWRR
jgi:uncharacterized protein YjiS (DUF1127 family)